MKVRAEIDALRFSLPLVTDVLLIIVSPIVRRLLERLSAMDRERWSTGGSALEGPASDPRPGSKAARFTPPAEKIGRFGSCTAFFGTVP